MNAIGRNLRALIERDGLKQSSLARVAGVSEGSVSGWLSGRSYPRTAPLERIAEYYCVSMDELMSDSSGLYAKLHGLADAPGGATRPEPSPARMVPVRVLGAAHAGDPDVPWQLDGEAMLYEEIASRHPHCFALEVNGCCMDRVFSDHDHIFVDPDMEPRDGSIAVVDIDGETVVRRVRKGTDSLLLVAESHEAQPDILVRSGEARCVGCVFWWQARSESS